MVTFEAYLAGPHYNTLLDLSDADDEFTKRELNKVVDSKIRDLFVDSGVQAIVGLTLLHRHFPLSEGEKLVNYGAVAYPWDTTTMLDTVAHDIHPSSWRFASANAVVPYEFEYITPSGGAPDVVNPLAEAQVQVFLGHLGTLLDEHGLAHLFGVQRLDTIADVEPGVEFTAERANITLPLRASGPDGDNAVEALWVFDDSLVSGASEGITVYKKCLKKCVKKKTGHRKVHVSGGLV